MRLRTVRKFFAVLTAMSFSATILAIENRLDVSAIITKAEAKTLLGVEVRDAAARNVESGDGYYSKCNYYSLVPGKTLLIRVYQAAAGYDAQKEFDMVTKETAGAKPIADLGDKALLTSGTASGLPARVTMLYVMKKNALLTIGLGGLDPEIASEKIKSVAEKIIAQL